MKIGLLSAHYALTNHSVGSTVYFLFIYLFLYKQYDHGLLDKQYLLQHLL